MISSLGLGSGVLLLLAILLAVGLLWYLLPRRNLLPRPVARPPPGPVMRTPHVPAGTFVDAGHGWMRIGNDGALVVGADAFLAEALGPVDRVVLPTVGRWVNRGEPLFEVVIGRRSLHVPSPVEGEVQRVNDELASRPGSLTFDPYGKGWAVTIWNRNHQAAIRPLKIGPAAVSYLLQEVRHLVEFLPSSDRTGAPNMMADGGMPRRGVVAQLGERGWPLFQREFLRSDAPRGAP